MNGTKRQISMLGWALACAFTAAAGCAAAADYCVGNPSELQAALNDAESASNALFDTVVRIRQGTYHVGNTDLAFHGTAKYVNALELLGGYNSDCSARSINPDNTVFDGDGNALDINPKADLRIEGVRFQNMGVGGQLNLWSAADNITVRVLNNAFVGTGLYAVTGIDMNGYAMKFVNNRVRGYVKPSQTSLAAVYMAGLSQIRFTGNTIADNAGEFGLLMCSDSDVWLVDNIGWNNSGDDFRVAASCGDWNAPGDTRFRNNLYQDITLHSVGDSGSNIGGSDPLFVSPGAGNYRLQNASPAINTGINSSSMAGIDLAGNPRVVGSTVDIGAYESAIDDTVPVNLTVTNTSDGGAGSLRQALLDANANPDFTFVNFDIPGACPHTIAPASALPSITQGLRIDAYSQPGSAANTRTTGDNATRCIVLDGGNAIGTGLTFSGGSTSQFWLQGMAIEGFTGSGLRLTGGTNALVWGNQFGGKLGATTLSANGTNISLSGLSSSASIGGAAPAQRNVIASAIHNGIEVTSLGFFSSTGNEIVGNLIGTYGGESAAAGNEIGVWIATSGNTVSNNVVVNGTVDGVHLEGAGANGNTIDHNRIGRSDTICLVFPVPFCFEDSAPNARHGVRILSGAHDNIVQFNTIWNNGVMGVSLAGTGKGNRLSANSIYVNGSYGIDLEGSGNNDNDADANALNLPNRGLNYPVITRAYGGSVHGWVEGSLASINGSYQIQLFSSTNPDNVPTGEGEVFHRAGIALIFDASTGQNGSTNFRIALSSPSLALTARQFALTAIDSAGNTSEFSARSAYLCDVIFRNGVDDAVSDHCPAP
ncbi:MAG: right-handed parallel beta-helix repeat-containing protein [Dokdonella sp.]